MLRQTLNDYSPDVFVLAPSDDSTVTCGDNTIHLLWLLWHNIAVVTKLSPFADVQITILWTNHQLTAAFNKC